MSIRGVWKCGSKPAEPNRLNALVKPCIDCTSGRAPGVYGAHLRSTSKGLKPRFVSGLIAGTKVPAYLRQSPGPFNCADDSQRHYGSRAGLDDVAWGYVFLDAAVVATVPEVDHEAGGEPDD